MKARALTKLHRRPIREGKIAHLESDGGDIFDEQQGETKPICIYDIQRKEDTSQGKHATSCMDTRKHVAIPCIITQR